MANECIVFEMIRPRGTTDIRPVPFLARTTASSGDTVTFTKSTQMVTIYSTLAGTVDFTAADGTAPTGSLAPFPIDAGGRYDFDVRPGTKVKFT